MIVVAGGQALPAPSYRCSIPVLSNHREPEPPPPTLHHPRQGPRCPRWRASLVRHARHAVPYLISPAPTHHQHSLYKGPVAQARGRCHIMADTVRSALARMPLWMLVASAEAANTAAGSAARRPGIRFFPSSVRIPATPVSPLVGPARQ